jgi:hypothetical protein
MALTELDGYINTFQNNIPTLVSSKITIDLEKVIAYQRYVSSTNQPYRDRQITQIYVDGNDGVYFAAMSPETFGKLLPIGPGVDPHKVKVSSADTTADFLENKLVAGTGISIAKLNPGADEDLEIRSAFENIYLNDGNVADGRVATLDGALTWDRGKEIRTVNGRIIREVTEASDLPATLVANTTYIIRGEINISSSITCNVEGVEIIGLDRNSDHLIWEATGPMLTIVDVNFSMSSIRLSGTRATGSIISATNVDAAGFNTGRLKVLTFLNCQFRGTYDVMDIKGFDLVDVNNCLFFYIKAQNFGLRFEDTSKIEITSCELIRWFDETTIPTPGGWSTCSMIELLPNNLASFGAVNINGCVIHPQQTQNGIEIATGSTTGFGTISSNAFVTIGLTTGKIFLPEVPVVLLPDYSSAQTTGYDVFANQGLLNSVSGTVMTLTRNTTITSLTQNVPTQINMGGGATQQASVRFTTSAAGVNTYIGTKQVYVSLHCTITFDKQGSGADDYTFYYYKNGTQLPGSQTQVRANPNDAITMVYGTLMNNSDTIELYVENTSSNDDMLVTDLQLVIRE